MFEEMDVISGCKCKTMYTCVGKSTSYFTNISNFSLSKHTQCVFVCVIYIYVCMYRKNSNEGYEDRGDDKGIQGCTLHLDELLIFSSHPINKVTKEGECAVVEVSWQSACVACTSLDSQHFVNLSMVTNTHNPSTQGEHKAKVTLRYTARFRPCWIA